MGPLPGEVILIQLDERPPWTVATWQAGRDAYSGGNADPGGIPPRLCVLDPNEIVSISSGLKDVRVLSYAPRGLAGEITIEQQVGDARCPSREKRT